MSEQSAVRDDLLTRNDLLTWAAPVWYQALQVDRFQQLYNVAPIGRQRSCGPNVGYRISP